MFADSYGIRTLFTIGERVRSFMVYSATESCSLSKIKALAFVIIYVLNMSIHDSVEKLFMLQCSQQKNINILTFIQMRIVLTHKKNGY